MAHLTQKEFEAKVKKLEQLCWQSIIDISQVERILKNDILPCKGLYPFNPYSGFNPCYFMLLSAAHTKGMAEKNIIEFLNLFEQCGANMRAIGFNGENLLHAAVHDSHEEVAWLAISHYGIAINSRDGFGKTALHIAAEVGSVDLVKFLLKQGADIKLIDYSNRKPIHYAKGDVREYLLKRQQIDNELTASPKPRPSFKARLCLKVVGLFKNKHRYSELANTVSPTNPTLNH